MLRKDIEAFLYKLQTVHKLDEEINDHTVAMCETDLLNYYETQLLRIVLHLSGRVNRHNTRIWGAENPKVIEEKSVIHQSLLCGVQFSLKAS